MQAAVKKFAFETVFAPDGQVLRDAAGTRNVYSDAGKVVDPSALGLRGIGAVADLVDDVWDNHNPELELTGVIVNKVPAVSSEADRRYDELIRIVGKRAIWQPVIPHRVIVNQAIGERRPVHAYGSRSADVADVFDSLWAKLRRTTRQ
jgi:cellulose biosynthesis protein BcsQ